MLVPRTARAPLWLLLTLAIFSPPAGATSITFTVQEPSGVARINDPVTSGIPIATGDTSKVWALFDGAREIPVQTRVLFGIRTPWLLLDFKSSVDPAATKTYTLISQAPTVAASPALSIDDAAQSSIKVVTGPLRITVGKNPFNLFDGVWLDRNHDGSFGSSERLVSSTSSDNLPLVLADNTIRPGRRVPLRWSWEDRGPLRATLRVDGYYGDPGVVSDTLLYYTDRITFHAGQTYVTVDHLIRNSFHASERYVKVRSARLLVPGSNPAAGRIRRSGDCIWLQPRNGGASFEMIPDSLTYTADFQKELRTQETMIVSSNGGMIIPDWSYHGARARFEFADTTLSGGERTLRRTRFIDRLAALAPASWYSDQGAFGSEQFSTWEDEQAANRQWGWTWPNDTPSPIPNVSFACYSAEHALARPGWDYYPSWASLSAAFSVEEDDLWANLLMYARVGQRTYLDRAERWARYRAWEYAYRTDGFAHQDQTHCDTLARARNDLPAGVPFTSADIRFIYFNTQNEISRGRNVRNHSWNGGLVDWYYITGDRDALEAALDIAEQSKKYAECTEIDSLQGGGDLRFFARSYLNLLRAWEATGSPYWRLSANRLKAMFFHSAYYDPRGFYYSPKHPHYPGGKYICPFQTGIVSQALYRDWVLTGHGSQVDSLAVRLRALAWFAFSYGADRGSGLGSDEIVLDYPSAGAVLHMSTDMLRDSTETRDSTPSSSNSLIDALVIGRRLGGPRAFMNQAKKLWEHASKYVKLEDHRAYRIADNAHVGRFVHTLQCWDGIGPTDAELVTMQFFFHDVARSPGGAGEANAAAESAAAAGPAEASADAQADDRGTPRVVEFALAGPNPVRGPSMVAFGIPASMAGQWLEISIFDLAGRRVRTLQAGAARAGRFRVPWNEASSLPSGAYFLSMRLGQETRSRKFVLIR